MQAATVSDLTAFLEREFAQVASDFVIERLTEDGIDVRLRVADRHLRPGGTVSGPSMFALADVAIYLAILSRIGPIALAVTTSANIDFLRKPMADTDLIATCRLLKLGRALAVGEVLIYSEGADAPVARAAMTYSIPPDRRAEGAQGGKSEAKTGR
ncbi:MAG: PaaI family thioesterase [Rhodobacteraceae bacterium]|nr:PaaI family thioesterase [Paracoccaceae bacterium]